MTGNSASYGGGANDSTLNNCSLTSNSASGSGGGAEESTLNNCTLSGNSASQEGGGALGSTLNDCLLTGNSAPSGGGAGAGSTLNNCTLTSNSAQLGGGAESSTLYNCTLTGNSALASGGGAYQCTLGNCIVFYNLAPDGNYDSGSILNYSCTTPLPPGGTGNLSLEPELASTSHLSVSSPCRGAGSAAYASGVDIDGEPWANPPSIGCDELWTGSITGALTAGIVVDYTNIAAGFSVNLEAVIAGRLSASAWDFGDGTVVSNRPYATHAWATAGDYPVVLRVYSESFPTGVAAALTVHVVTQPVHYVALNGSSPVAPYGSWATAATDIQDAVDAATVPGAMVLVSNGVYQAGARAVYGMSNRVAVTTAVILQSLNGPAVTSIAGYQVPGTTNGDAAVRCLYLTNGAVLSGFTLTNGATQTNGDWVQQQCGGGVWCESRTALVTNCLFVGNSAYNDGGGAFAGTFNNCTFTGNSAGWGGGACVSTLSNATLSGNSATYGGGAEYCALNNCTLTSNSASDSGGGADESTLNGCTLAGNSATYGGGGASSSVLNHCAIVGNTAGGGGGASDCIINNSTLSGNTAWGGGGGAAGTLNNCTLINNTALDSGGGVSFSTLNNCTLISNSAAYLGGGTCGGNLTNCTLIRNSALVSGGGAGAMAGLYNCIVYYNTAPDGNYQYQSESLLHYCCTTPLPPFGQEGNFTNAPLLVDLAGGNLRLQANSPCINAGLNAYAAGPTDLDDNPRISGGTIDVGAYEFQNPASRISYAWLQSYGLATDGSADYQDSDGDGMNNWQEWIAGTDPTNPTSALRLLSPTNSLSGLLLSWTSVANRTYFLQRASNLVGSPAFSPWQSNLTGQVGITSFVDTNGASLGAFYYRVGIQQ